MSDQHEAFLRDAEKVSRNAAREARLHGSTGARTLGKAHGAADAGASVGPPIPDHAMFYGLVGDVAAAAARNSEVNPVAAGAGFLSFLGAMVGRDAYYAVGNTWHHPRLFTLHIGRSSRGGKGEALSLTKRIRDEVVSAYPGLLGQSHDGGLSTREGLAMLIHDGYTLGREAVDPIDDKRLWVIEEEFSNVLSQTKREGNTLSAALRELWDGGAIKPATKSCRIWASHPHVGLAAAITPSELHHKLSGRELSNGFANRFLMFWAERTCEVPHPEPTAPAVLLSLAARTAQVITFAKGAYPKQRDSRSMLMSHDARVLWEDLYRRLKRSTGSDHLDALLERRAPHALRLAMLFALSDQALVVEAWHLRAAQAWVAYSSHSVRYVFANQAREATAAETGEVAGRIARFLAERPPGATSKEIIDECFSRRWPSQTPIGDVLAMMVSDPQHQVEMIEQPRLDGRPGRPRKVYRLSSNSCGISGVRSAPQETNLES